MLITIRFDTPGCDKVLEQLSQGPIKMSPTVAGCSADILELIDKKFVIYDAKSGQLKLIRDAQ